MPWRLSLSAVVFVVLGVVIAQDKSSPGTGLRLDNGKDLAGWTGDTEGWSVVGGTIRLDAGRAKETIFHEKAHSDNCAIALEFKASPGGDSGVYIHGKQFQVRDYPTAGPMEYARFAKPAGEWNRLEFDFTVGYAVVRLNGQIIERSWRIGIDPMKGLGLQFEKGDFEFRNITLAEKSAPVQEPTPEKAKEPRKKKK